MAEPKTTTTTKPTPKAPAKPAVKKAAPKATTKSSATGAERDLDNNPLTALSAQDLLAALGDTGSDDPSVLLHKAVYSVVPGKRAKYSDKDVVLPMSQAFNELFSETKLTTRYGVSLGEMQQRMFLAGFYGSAKWKDVLQGTPDALTQRAFDQLLSVSAASFKAGSTAPVMSVLGKFMSAGIEQGRSFADDDGRQGPTRPAAAVPGVAEIAQMVKTSVSSLLGREPDEAELAELAATLTSFTRQEATQRQDLAVAADGTQAVVEDSSARFAEHLSQRYKPEVTRNTDVKQLAGGRDNLMKTVMSLDQIMGR